MEKLYTFRRMLSAAVLLMMSTLSWAYDFEVDGIFYNINWWDEESVEVTYQNDDHDYPWYDSGKKPSGDIVIPSTVSYNGVVYKVTGIGDETFWGCSSLTSISIPEGVTYIGRYAFSDCTSLASISIPRSVEDIRSYAFRRCPLTSISLPEGVSIIGSAAFYGCSSLTSVTCHAKCRVN